MAAARTSAGWPSSARLAGPISSALCTAASRPPPIAISSESGHGSIAMSAKPASPRMRFTRSSEAKANGPGIFRPLLRQFRHVFVDRLQRRHHPRIFARLAPAGECQPSRRPQRLAHVRERQHRIGEEHHAEPRGQQIETLRVERIDGGVGQHEIDRQILRRTRSRPLQHRAGDIDAEHMA